jgi:hypothetical protein
VAVNAGLTDLSVRCVAIDPQTPSTLYALAYTTVFKSIDGGASWSAAGTGLPAFPSAFDLVVDPQTPTTLYVAIYTGDAHTGPAVFKSTNGGGSWSEIDVGFNATRFIAALTIDPPDTDDAVCGRLPQSCVFKARMAAHLVRRPLGHALQHLRRRSIATPTTIYATMGLPSFVGGVYKA